MTSYEEIIESGKLLSTAERVQLAGALLAEDLGFGMCCDRDEVAEAEAFVSDLRHADMRTPNGREKTREEFHREVSG